MEWMLILFVIAWLISPIVLLTLWLHERAERKKREQMLHALTRAGRVSTDELVRNGVSLPPAVPQPMMQPVVPQPPPLTNPQPFVQPQAVMQQPAVPQTTARPGTAFMPPTYNGGAVQPLPPVSAADAVNPAQQTRPQTVPVQPAPNAPAPVYAPQYPAAGTPPVPVTPVPAAYAPPVSSSAAPQKEFKISAITAMLAVGVVLIVIAGLLFVRSAWDSLGDFGKLTTLAMGSVLFFGASALARRTFHLARTGMAFFVIGAAFLPISIWAAGCFELLGDNLSGPSNNLLITLSFLAFTVISLIAVRMYRQIGWGIAALFGMTLTYLYCVRALLAADRFEDDFQWSVFFLFSAAFALLLAFGSRPVREHLPLPIAVPLEPFALGYAFFHALMMFAAFAADELQMLYGAAALLSAAVFFAPAVTDRIRSFSALPVGILALTGFALLFHPLHGHHSYGAEQADDPVYLFYGAAFAVLILSVCTLLYLALLLTNSLPDTTKKGYQIGAYVFLFAALLPQLFCEVNLPLAILLGVVLAATAFSAVKSKDLLLRGLTAAQTALLSFVIMQLPKDFSDAAQALLLTVLLAAAYVIFVLTKRLRTTFSDFLFPVSVTVLSAVVMSLSASSGSDWAAMSAAAHGQFIAGFALLLATAGLYWALSMAHDTEKPRQYAYAALLPATLLLAAVTPAFVVDDRNALLALIWSVVCYGIALITYFTTKKRFHGVRRLLFALTSVPPLIFAVFSMTVTVGGWSENGGWAIALMLLGAAMAILLWMLFSHRGFRGLGILSFSAALFLILEPTFFSLNYATFETFRIKAFSFPVWMMTALWIVAASIAAILISKRLLFFVGSDVIPAVMQFVMPLTALLFSLFLLALGDAEWAALFPVFTVALCILAWLTTKREQFVLPAGAGLALLLTLGAVRRHIPWDSYGDVGSNIAVAVLLLVFAGMTVLFPYLGIVAREGDLPDAQKRRSYVLTALGGAVPLWLMLIARNDQYTDAQQSWLRFFVPVLIAGYLLHFTFSANTKSSKKAFLTAASAFFLIACWIQPFFDVDGTYWDGKLHLLPLIAFGVVLRFLYGSAVGGNFLFGIGVYGMIRLGLTSIFSEDTADLLSFLICAMVMFVISFYVKQKKWFLLGGISLVCIALYLRTKLDVQWWIYLLLAGMMLIAIAAVNELLKQRGESLKEKAGRFWEDWIW